MPARPAPKTALYRVRNWGQYNEALVRRGSLTLWVDQAALQAWQYRGPTQRGAQFQYGDSAIECLLTLRAVYHLTPRATEGSARSLFGVMGLDLAVPGYSTLSRRAETVRITLPRKAAGPLHLILDSTGLKAYGEGEWKVRQHGYSRRRTWLKPHLAVDPERDEIQAAVVSEPGVTDEAAVPALVEQVEEPIPGAGADGAYDRRTVYEEVAHRGARAVIPPRRDAKNQRHGNSGGPRLARDENLRRIRRVGRVAGKRESGYYRRSPGEMAMFRMQPSFGTGVPSRGDQPRATVGGSAAGR